MTSAVYMQSWCYCVVHPWDSRTTALPLIRQAIVIFTLPYEKEVTLRLSLTTSDKLLSLEFQITYIKL